MTQAPTEPEAPAAATGPLLLHAGTYALYQTPAGGYHLSYRREWSTDETGQSCQVADAPDVHCRDLSPRAAEMLAQLLDRDVPIPPMIQAFLDGGRMPSLGAIMKQARTLAGQLGPGELEPDGQDGPAADGAFDPDQIGTDDGA